VCGIEIEIEKFESWNKIQKKKKLIISAHVAAIVNCLIVFKLTSFLVQSTGFIINTFLNINI
jgi:hypothetical protein